MGTLYISEYPGRTAVVGGGVDVGEGARAVCQRVVTGGTAAQSTPFHGYARFAVLTADVPMFVAFGSSPTAATDGTSIYLPAGVPMPFGVIPGHRLSAVDA